MDRRSFVKKSAVASAASLLTISAANAQTNEGLQLIKPKALKKGDTIGLITPASAVTRQAFEKAVDNLESMGFEAKYSENMSVRKGFLAGTDQQRLDDLHQMFKDPNIDGIVCARGGYGSGRLLSKINYDLIKANPKVLMGYSDITALLYGIHKKTGMVCFHGPVGASEYSEFTEKGFERVLMKGKTAKFDVPKAWEEIEDPAFQTLPIVAGVAEGALVGGNLSLMCSLMGTPYDIDFKDKIVFIEEIGESPYRVDRMLTQLLNSGKLSQAKGIAIGVFKGCETKPDDPDFALSTSLENVLKDRFSNFNIPVLYGLPIGHIDDNATLPFGIQAELDVEKASLKLLESGVE
ncbi:muramoyltetrapeptide carboxypeptidase [Reichenbachiella faecimaris]|uniref:Muramoyltetrapeptide carboxypeptidase n=1 Tax=Reichenbachiella faecimaris TaxID=692418 RepID=A0A1W2GM61_REIFA|nr:LD-carboxypeptidase [Reichenbachiella faecimaris]SMD37356.1 muramoyltetrapeptide carboxypeptidase [Reichenbachiella faecimaris]